MKVAVLFHRFGPYHQARLQAAGSRCELYGIEVSGETNTYDWDRVKGSAGFEHITVYPEGNIRDLPAQNITSYVDEVLSGIRPDVVAIPGWSFPDALAATAWCRRTGTPSVVMSASTARDFSRSGWKEAVKRQVVRMHQAGLVGGRPHAAYLTQLGMPKERISHGYNVVDNWHFANGAEGARRRAISARRNLGLPEQYFLTACRFVKKKNLGRLLQAYATYQSNGDAPWELVILGDGPLKGNLLEQAAQYGVAGRVHLPGFKQYDDLPAYYGLANAFLLASTTEQWGLVVNEAMAAGLPVLVSEHCGCAPELVQEGENGFTFDPLDAPALARLMTRIAGGQCDRSAMGARSQAIISRWTPERFADGLMEAAQRAQSVGSSRSVFDSKGLQLLQRISAVV